MGSLIPLIPFLWLLLEVAGFVIVGHAIGLLATLGLVVLGAIAGSALLRLQGFFMLQRLQMGLAAGETPAASMVNAAAFALAGVLLIIPGFFGDIVALILILGPVRRWLLRWIEFRLSRDGSITFGRFGNRFGTGPRRGSDPGVIDGEYTTLDDGVPRRPDPPAGGSDRLPPKNP